MKTETVSCWCGRSVVTLDASGNVDENALPVDLGGADDDYDPVALEASGQELAICMCGRLERADVINGILNAAEHVAASA